MGAAANAAASTLGAARGSAHPHGVRPRGGPAQLPLENRELRWDEMPENYLGTALSQHPSPERRAATAPRGGGRCGVPPWGCSRLAGNPLRRSLKLRGVGSVGGLVAFPGASPPKTLPCFTPPSGRKSRCRRRPRCWHPRPTAAGWQLALRRHGRRDSAPEVGTNPQWGASHPQGDGRGGGPQGLHDCPPPAPTRCSSPAALRHLRLRRLRLLQR